MVRNEAFFQSLEFKIVFESSLSVMPEDIFDLEYSILFPRSYLHSYRSYGDLAATIRYK